MTGGAVAAAALERHATAAIVNVARVIAPLYHFALAVWKAKGAEFAVMIIAEAFKLNIDWRLLGNLLVAAIFGGGISAAIVANIFAKRRDRENRRIEFLKKMGRLRTKVYRYDPHFLRRAFSEEVAHFGGEYVAFEHDLRGSQKEKFHRLCDEIVAMKDSELSSGKAKLLERIEQVIRVLE